MANSKLYLGNTNIGSLFQGASDISIYLGQNKVYPLGEPVFDGKWKATYSDSSVTSGECGTAVITENEIDKTNLVSVEIGECCSSVGINAFKDYSTLSSVKFNEGLVSIDTKSFMNCVNLLSVTFPTSLNSIFTDSFSGCTGLQSITFLSETPIRVYSSTFYDSTCPIYVPAESVEDYKTAQGWSTYADRIQAIPTL